ncbi:hypothetical protein, partial [Pseudoalteromonas atlantica]|uniref:hypothetical protein n=1 Tax=Pseudoalteromonas atlantica TaxID=288 RepID=UPI00296E83F8
DTICTNVAQLVTALPTLYAHAEIAGSNPLSRTKFILTSLNKLHLRIPICTNAAQLVNALPNLYAPRRIQNRIIERAKALFFT